MGIVQDITSSIYQPLFSYGFTDVPLFVPLPELPEFLLEIEFLTLGAEPGTENPDAFNIPLATNGATQFGGTTNGNFVNNPNSGTAYGFGSANITIPQIPGNTNVLRNYSVHLFNGQPVVHTLSFENAGGSFNDRYVPLIGLPTSATAGTITMQLFDPFNNVNPTQYSAPYAFSANNGRQVYAPIYYDNNLLLIGDDHDTDVMFYYGLNSALTITNGTLPVFSPYNPVVRQQAVPQKADGRGVYKFGVEGANGNHKFAPVTVNGVEIRAVSNNGSLDNTNGGLSNIVKVTDTFPKDVFQTVVSETQLQNPTLNAYSKPFFFHAANEIRVATSNTTSDLLYEFENNLAPFGDFYDIVTGDTYVVYSITSTRSQFPYDLSQPSDLGSNNVYLIYFRYSPSDNTFEPISSFERSVLTSQLAIGSVNSTLGITIPRRATLAVNGNICTGRGYIINVNTGSIIDLSTISSIFSNKSATYPMGATPEGFAFLNLAGTEMAFFGVR